LLPKHIQVNLGKRLSQKKTPMQSLSHVWGGIVQGIKLDNPLCRCMDNNLLSRLATRLMSEHLRSRRRSNTHTLFVYYWSSKKVCSPSPRVSNLAKFGQFGKERGK
jgi:hypothetical protein